MPKLFVLSGKDLGATFEVGESALIGRSPECDVRLTDGSIGRRHARLEREGIHWHLIDLGSANGILHRGERVERVVLMDLEEVTLGRVQLRFREEEIKQEDASVPVERSRPRAPRRRPVAEDELELEEEIDLESLAPKPSEPESSASDSPTNSIHADAQAAEERRAQVLRKGGPRGGFLTDALEDRPLWLTLLLLLVVLAIAGGLGFGMYRLVVGMRMG